MRNEELTVHTSQNATNSNQITGTYADRKNLKGVKLNYDNITLFPQYMGPGAYNEKVTTLNDNSYIDLRNKSLRSDVNTYISDIIGIKRILPDNRPAACKEITYPVNLPPVSVIIIFRDEPISSLLRTVYSVLETSPKHLVLEVILVDDGSTDMTLNLAVDIHVRHVDKLKLVRNERPLGLMMARQRGIEVAKSDFFIVLDGHIEVTPGWLEPVINRLVQRPKSLLTSHIGLIDRETFHFSIWHYDQIFILFDQITLAEEWVHYSDAFRKSRNGSVAPIEYGIVPGMMIAMRKTFFLALGGFDPGMEVWGSEHMELSVKVWLCGGSVEMLPCSQIGHLYRMTPWHKIYPGAKYIGKNILRFILVWMDGDLQKLALEVQQKGNISKPVDPGDLTERHRIKITNQCKPYEYYIEQLLRISSTFVPRNLKLKGLVFNQAKRACLDMADEKGRLELIIYPCSGNSNQFFILTEDSNMRVDRAWVKAELHQSKPELKRDIQDWSKLELKWIYEENGAIRHVLTGRCLTVTTERQVILENCEDSPFQRWQWPRRIS